MRTRSKRFLWSGLLAFPLLAIALVLPFWASTALILLSGIAIGITLYSHFHEQKIPLDFLKAARLIESENPEINQSLVTAVENELSANAQKSFFSKRVLDEALEQPSRKGWKRCGRKKLLISRIQYLGSLGIYLLVMLATYLATENQIQIQIQGVPQESLADTSLSVEPGDVEIERGSSQVLIARFTGTAPTEARLELTESSGETTSLKMAKSLSDPVFAYTLTSVSEPVSYRIAYADQSSESYQIEVFDLPTLVRADVSLDYPEYTGWQDRSIEDTLRVSAIEGTHLEYRFATNKAIREAYLEDDNGNQIDLRPTNNAATQFVLSDNIRKSANYSLRLIDLENRKNAIPPKIRIEAIPNKRPSLIVDTPQGDQRFTALQEIQFSGLASDDFGLLDYGIGFAFSGDESSEQSLKTAGQTSKELKADLSFDVSLEARNAAPRDSFSWYLWADDFAPDGSVRRTTGDLFFAEVRPFDEIFREQDQGGTQQGQAAGQGLDLLEKQRRITISLFRIKNDEPSPASATENLNTIQQSQFEAYTELQQIQQMLEKPAAVEAAREALRFMEGVEVSLVQAIDETTLGPLPAAWSDAQSAYQELLKLNDSEFAVSRSQNQGGGSGRSASSNQRQIDELDFRQEDSRYETSTQAQALSSPEERQNLELIAKLNELSRRQDDLNDRLQEMQAAIANAKTEEERREAERELKRLEEEQRQLMQNADEAIQQAANREGSRETREQLQEARERMQQSADQLQEGQVSQALASGSRARETLEQSKEQMRKRNSSAFSEAMREARRQARDLAENQERLQQDIENFEEEFGRSLDDRSQREALADEIDQQSEDLESFLQQIQEVAEGSEAVEPGLYRDLYQLLRDSSGAEFEERYNQSSQLLRQGFLSDANTGQSRLTEDLQELSDRVAQAAGSILGNESAELAFAEEELEDLQEQLDSERRSSGGSEERSPSGAPTSANSESASPAEESSSGSLEDQLRQAFSEFGGATGGGPITGGGFDEWIERLSTVEALIEEPQIRSRIEEARERAEDARRDFKRHGELPQWDMVENGIATPLNEASAWLRSELNRIENPDTLQPVDSDPVPEAYESFVRRYYESLGDD
ncbi:hypothetical protein [Pelagicoccus albus]|uniref:DUF4175 family protein n=1 Tax=Pelagicoccus albus TaxID=415222 RepID=A0A7X1B582_9BACT|nr:hypothetical protein [Pelagicoccus albus]MBC2604783.1 hypothetical protein [Pelagicoccus albus]